MDSPENTRPAPRESPPRLTVSATAVRPSDGSAADAVSVDRDGRYRVVQVVNSLAPAGAERLTAELSRALDPREFDVHVLVVRDGRLREYVEAAGLPLLQTGFEFDHTFPFVVARMSAYLREQRPDIVHTHLLGSDIVGRLAAVLAGTPIIISTQHDVRRRPWIYRAYRRITAHLVDATVACSPSVATYCRSEMGFPEERLTTIENGVDIERFSAGISPWREPVTFGALGSLIGVKGHANLIRAFKRVAEELPGSRLLIAGDGVERPALEKLVADLGLEGSAQILGRVDDVVGFLSDIDVFVHPSLSEGMPLALLEAMAAAKPIVASDIPALSDALGRDAGVLVPPDDPDALSDALIEVASNPADAQAMGREAHERAAERYPLSRTVSDYAALYRSLLQREGLVAPDGTRVSEDPQRRRFVPRWVQGVMQALLLLAVGFFVYRSLRSGFQESGFVNLAFNPAYLGASITLLLGYYVAFVGGLNLIFRALGTKLSYPDTFKLAFVSNLGKYLPGGIWPVASRLAIAPRVGVRRHTMLFVSALESALSVTGASLVFLLGIVAGGRTPIEVPVLTSLAALAVAAVILHPSFLRRAVGWTMRLLRIQGEPPHVSFRWGLGLILYYALTWVVGGLAFYAFARAIVADPGTSPFAYAGYFAAAAIAGLIVLFAPGGLGAREGALLLLLTTPLGAASAAVVTLASRVWTAITELVLSGIAMALRYRATETPLERPREATRAPHSASEDA